MVDKTGPFRPIVPEMPPVTPLSRSGGSIAPPESDFRTLLEREEIVFSSHARKRMEQRGIAVDSPMLDGLQRGMRRLAEKGGRDALVMMQDLTFVVNVPHRTVVTCIDSDSRRGNVFTNIDSAVILE